LNRFECVAYGRGLTLGDGVSATFHNSGHILGSSYVRLSVQNSGRTVTVLFSGDIGRKDRPIIRDPDALKSADYVVMESTYGNRLHSEGPDIETAMAELINAAVGTGGNVLIPSFAVERSQEVLYHINGLLMEKKIPRVMVFLDSPMAAGVTKVFTKHPELFDKEMRDLMAAGNSPFTFAGLKMTSTTAESKAINSIRGTAIIVAGSGMCTGGRIKHHLVNNISRPESAVAFVGYQAVGTLGRQIIEGRDPVRILGQDRPVKARITKIRGFSAHADRGELLEWLFGLGKPPRRVFITHGEKEAARELARRIKEKNGWQVSVPDYGDEAVLD
jgi:metallo-beta-lactamase family protein